MSQETPDLAGLHARFNALPPGAQADMRRAETPEDLRATPALYRLFPGARPTPRQIRLAFILPWCPNERGQKRLAALLADEISEQRLIQVVRTPCEHGKDLIQFRRIIRQLHPRLGWLDIAETLYFWGVPRKRKLVEDFFMALHRLDQGATS
ncbi:CRISPR-associated protein Cse2 [Lamprobacter modestohalophilus]|uniref:CRISPR-associated protein Cse2 n=1 Tax=Lamprobacter modestohalophilus TaxID=1064514 RepID=UPI002ADEA7F7|nr:CRISPR-associated protein Cse2 [Lamprobacter modestohalophilus]MEA1050881.1 CRISPR-associated protein Cse2 [Lamprobacter modestohalophilus]